MNQPEPELKSYSVTVKADGDKLARMHADALETFSPALAQLMAATPEPWINAIFDREPLRRWAFGRCALVGEAAHPTSPHGLRCAQRLLLRLRVNACVLRQPWAGRRLSSPRC